MFRCEGRKRDGDFIPFRFRRLKLRLHPVGSSLLRLVMKKFEQLGVYSALVWVLSDSPYRRFYELHHGHQVESKTLEISGFKNEVTAYGWLDIKGKF